MAWLHATPKPDARSRRGREEPAESRLSRIDDLKRKKINPPMPANPAPHIVDRLIEIGLTEAAGMGAGPLSWGRIAAWQECTSVRLEPWEARLIQRLSSAYLAEGRRAESEACPPPWKWAVTQREIDVEQGSLRQVLG